jgi:hypothetical protein
LYAPSGLFKALQGKKAPFFMRSKKARTRTVIASLYAPFDLLKSLQDFKSIGN